VHSTLILLPLSQSVIVPGTILYIVFLSLADGEYTLECRHPHSHHHQATYFLRADTYPMRYFLGRKMLIDPMLIHYLTSRRELYTQISPQLAEHHIGLVEPWDGFPGLFGHPIYTCVC
jgi:hypothetical protein